jgi:hypothetical protein
MEWNGFAVVGIGENASSRGRRSSSRGSRRDTPGNPGIFLEFLEKYSNTHGLLPILEELFFS